MSNPFQLIGKNILVTGASAGIGRAVAILCTQMGASVTAVGRNEDRLKETFLNFEGEGHRYCIVDVTESEQIEALIEQSDTFDGIVLCASINDKSLLKFVNQKKIDDIYKVNVFSPILLIKELLRRKKLNKGASIVMLSSISSIYATISNALYASSKGAINSLVKALALECSSQRIRVNGVMPGMVETNMIKAYNLSSDEMDSVIRTYPLGRLGTPNDIANGVVYLLSDASNWVTGINLVIDGGVTLR